MTQVPSLVLVIALFVLFIDPGDTCFGGDYCSLGKVGGYVGPLDTAVQLKEALEKTAYKKEIIVSSDSRISFASQALARFREAGYGHAIMVMDDALQCQHLRAVFLPWLEAEGPISCGSYARKDPVSGEAYESGFKYFKRGIGIMDWWRKWFTVGRAVALGYNVMAVDSDVLVIDDWYLRAKTYPLNQFNMLTQNEWGINFNGGFSYIQNASSNGPVVWILFEAMHRLVRWAEDGSELERISPFYREHKRIPLDDQGMLQECLHSAVAGRPAFPSVMAIYTDDPEAYAALGANNSEVYHAIHGPVQKAWRHNEVYKVDDALTDKICEWFQDPTCRTDQEKQVIISTASLRMPHSGGEWPGLLGGYPFNRTAGPLTTAYRQAYKDLGVPLPPDPEDPATQEAARAAPTELFGFLSVRRSEEHCHGCWAESSWWMTGRHGWWHRHLVHGAQHRVGIGHIWANLSPGDYQKEAILIATGWYNWKVAARVAKTRPRLYKANQHCTNMPVHGVHVPEVRSVVAYRDGVVHAGLSKEQFVRAAQGLAQVAVALGAVAAWPAVPCDSDWVLTEAARSSMPRPIQHTIPWNHLNTAFKVLPFGKSLEGLRCEWPGFSHFDCLCNGKPQGEEIGRGMLAMEFEHLRETSEAMVKTETTVRLKDGHHPAPLADKTAFEVVAYTDLLRLNAQSVLFRLQREAMPVFWLDRLVEVPDLAGEAAAVYGRWKRACFALGYPDRPAHEKEVV